MPKKPYKIKAPFCSKDISVFKRNDWRTLTPFHKNKKSACRTGCPLGNNIPGWLNLTKASRWGEASRLLKEYNPFPMLCGFICHHPCMAKCLRGQFDESIDIKRLELALGIYSLKPKQIKPLKSLNGKKVTIIGAGPAGLSCAWDLVNEGYKVAIFESSDRVGGIPANAIPEFRLSSAAVKAEMLTLITHPYLRVILNRPITKEIIEQEMCLNKTSRCSDAIFIAVGARKSQLPQIPIKSGCVVQGLDYLEKAKRSNHGFDYETVVIIGGGNTAIDAARTAKRIDHSENVTVFYRRTEKEMPANKEEIEEAKKEGVNFRFLFSPVSIEDEKITFQKMTLGETDASGRATPIPTNETVEIIADQIILAIGEKRGSEDLSVEEYENREAEGIFIGGDALNGPSFVSKAIASGKEASIKIRKFLGEEIAETDEPQEIAEFSNINTAYFKAMGRQEKTMDEASRCFSCGLCPENTEACHNCWKFCPDMSVKITDKNGKPEIDFDHCKGCLVCAEECPRGAISFREGK